MIETLKAGEVSAIDSKTGKVRVLLKGDDDKTTDWLNLLVPFSESHSDNYMLEVGQTVYCLFFSEMPEQGIVLGCPMRGSSGSKTEVKRIFSDGGSWSYEKNTLTLNIKKIVINGDLEVSGTTKTGGSINLNTHKHSGVMIGGDKTGGPE